MAQGRPAAAISAPAAPRVGYVQGRPEAELQRPDTLAVVQFGPPVQAPTDPRQLYVQLPQVAPTGPLLECWRVQGPVHSGREGEIGWARNADWLFAHIEVAEADHGHDIARAAEHAYRSLCGFLTRQPRHQHVQRLWNYLDAINQGEGDAERYKHFCDGRAVGMGGFFAADGFPAATAIGLPAASGKLVLYCLAASARGHRIENPRQISAWRYPRQYGRTPPSFARAMVLPANDALAISGTAAITGHQSRHTGSLLEQLGELKANIDSLLESAHLAPGFGAHAPLKVYLRHVADAPVAAAFLARELPDTPWVMLHGDICRRELLIEVDGWRYA